MKFLAQTPPRWCTAAYAASRRISPVSFSSLPSTFPSEFRAPPSCPFPVVGVGGGPSRSPRRHQLAGLPAGGADLHPASSVSRRPAASSPVHGLVRFSLLLRWPRSFVRSVPKSQAASSAGGGLRLARRRRLLSGGLCLAPPPALLLSLRVLFNLGRHYRCA
jgi:hypothetical protein